MRAGSVDQAHEYVASVKQQSGLLYLLAVLVSPVLLAGVAGAIAPISQQFLSSGAIALGSVVSLHQDSSDEVDASTTANANNIIGVVISADSSPISLSSNQNNQVQVATSGVVPVLVSNINGSISVGDEVTSSPVAGVGMKATSNVKVVGISQGDLASTSNTEQQTYTDKSGQRHTILLGEVPVLVSVAYYFKQPDKTIVPQAIQNIADAVAGKEVNALPILISGAIFILTLVVVVTLIYSMIHGSIISVGRNPMSQAAVYRNLIQLSLLVIIVLGVSFAAIYLILTRF